MYDNVIAFLHIMKCAGSTMRTIIQRTFRAKDVWLIDPGLERPFSKYVVLTPQQKAQLKCIMGHWHFQQQPLRFPGMVRYVTVLRDPIERILSAYCYLVECRQSNLLSQRICKNKMTLGDCLEAGLPLHVENYQTLVLGGSKEKSPTRATLKKAKRNLAEHFCLVGLVERFDEFLALLHCKLGWEYKNCVKEKVALRRLTISQLSKSTINMLWERNQLDMELYRFVDREMDRKIQDATPRYEHVLAEIRGEQKHSSFVGGKGTPYSFRSPPIRKYVSVLKFKQMIEQTRPDPFVYKSFDCLPEGVKLRTDIVYVKRQGEDLLLDVYDKIPHPAMRPVIVFIHGGSWGRKLKGWFARQAAYLTGKYGLLSVCIEHRLSESAKFPACLDDVFAVLEWIKKKAASYDVGVGRIAMIGNSSGGHLAVLAGLQAQKRGVLPIAACVSYDGVMDMMDFAKFGSTGDISSRKLVGIGHECKEALKTYRRASPIGWVHKLAPPMLFLHGEADKCVPVEQSMRMHKALCAVGVHSEIEVYPGKPHEWYNLPPDFIPILERTERFLVDQLELAR